MRVGLIDLYSPGWTSGGEYTKAQLLSLVSTGLKDIEKLVLVTSRPEVLKTLIAPYDINDKIQFAPVFHESWLSWPVRLRAKVLEPFGVFKDPRQKHWIQWARSLDVDVLLPFSPHSWWRPDNIATCGLIQDMQHVYLPQFFSKQELAERDKRFQATLQKVNLICVSSFDTKKQLAEFLPEYSEKIRVYHFPSLLAFLYPDNNHSPTSVMDKYGISGDFLLITNQFWMHKNHLQVIEAMGQISSEDLPQVVMIGHPFDYRDQSGAYLSSIMQRIAQLRLEKNVKLLGFVSSEEKDVLLRACKALIQPSRFEGWNTSIEDAKALGKPVIASDIPVHREQLGEKAFAYVHCDNNAEMAEAIKNAGKSLPAGIDIKTESQSLFAAHNAAVSNGFKLLGYCQEAIALRRR